MEISPANPQKKCSQKVCRAEMFRILAVLVGRDGRQGASLDLVTKA